MMHNASRSIPSYCVSCAYHAPSLLSVSCPSGKHIDVFMQEAAAESRRARDRDTTLLRASSLGDASAVEALLGQGASASTACDQRRATPLHLAAARGHANVVETLLSHGCDVDVEDDEGRTGTTSCRLHWRTSSADAPPVCLCLCHVSTARCIIVRPRRGSTCPDPARRVA
jgi:Ankyrin repeats (3 copies)